MICRSSQKWFRCAGVVAALACFVIPLSGAVARVQSNEKLVAKFRADCRQKSSVRQASGKSDFEARMRQCIRDKLAASWSPPAEFPLVEFTPWLISNKGPKDAKGVIYFVAGWGGQATSDKFHLASYLMKRFNDDGWDVIKGKFPENFSYYPNPRLHLLADAAVPFVRKRLAELKAQGYRRILLAGHSWGAWVAMLTEQGAQHADAMLLSSPAIYGKRNQESGNPNPDFGKNFTEFGPALRGVKTPVVLTLFAGDELNESGDRAAAANTILDADKVPHLIINNPPGFSGHYAGWLPFFDFAYGNCIQGFLEAPRQGRCRLPPLANTDFRSILDLKQVADADKKKLASADSLVGRKFVAYTLRDRDNKHFDFIAATRRVTMETDSEAPEVFAFRNGQFCVGGKCSILVKWSDSQLLEFESATGRLNAWWLEDSGGK